MTHPFEKPDHPLPQLELPNWLPSPVAEEAQRVYDDILQQDRKLDPRPFTASEQIKVLFRLASDQRMKKVWNELRKKKRERPSEFLHPFIPDDLAVDENPQDMAPTRSKGEVRISLRDKTCASDVRFCEWTEADTEAVNIGHSDQTVMLQ